MPDTDREGIEEVFVIKTEEIDFFGALVREKGGKSAVSGRVWFRGGTRWYFASRGGERGDLRERLAGLSENVASLYGTHVFCLKFSRTMDYRGFIRRLREAKQAMARA
ncbi:MAG: hypothetical protein JRH07_02065 [Deltaproteobacteria bacterium]|nr:hypothetical protein [Deltaproteobacteria bacterium]MBW2120616.1 hypothetical protein [Deltaproteobacteria bacterium]